MFIATSAYCSLKLDRAQQQIAISAHVMRYLFRLAFCNEDHVVRVVLHLQ